MNQPLWTLKILVITILTQIVTPQVRATDQPYISVGAAKSRKTVIAFPAIKSGSSETTALTKILQETVASDLNFMDLFNFLPTSAYVEDTTKSGITLDKFKLTDWSSVGAEFLIKALLTKEEKGLALEAYLYDTQGSKTLVGKRYIATLNEAKLLGHSFAADIVKALTGLPGIFQTKIVMSCDRGSNRKELYIMNFDGSEVKQITHHRSIAFAPAWTPDASKIAYSLYTKRIRDNIKNIDLYELDFRTNTIRMLSNRKGMNSGATYHPDGRRIALTMSFLGNPEIFTFDPTNSSVTRLTNATKAADVDPVWSPDGSKLAFVSDRTGASMIFTMNADGSNTQRLTFAGHYNATPTWSPQNNKIAFAGWIDHSFDIFTINPDGTNIERLTKSQGNNEDPHFSPDGNFIVFSSNRTGQKNIYVMNVDGTFTKRLTYSLGNCVAPKWSSNTR